MDVRETVTCHQSVIKFCNSLKHWNTIQKIVRVHSFLFYLVSLSQRETTENAYSRLHKNCVKFRGRGEEYKPKIFTVMFGCFTLIHHVLLHSNVIMDEFNISRKLQDSNTLNVNIKLKYAMLQNRM